MKYFQYTSEGTAREIFLILSEALREDVFTDEVTDIATTEVNVTFVQYVRGSEVQVDFLFEGQIISGCLIDDAISVRVDGGFGSYRLFVYITTLLLRDASWILILYCGPPEPPQCHLYC